MLHKDRSPIVSIIIPCYNHGKYIDDTVQSIDRIADKNSYEVIIVNDGSTDAYTNERLEALSKTGLYHIVHQQNQGVCVTRNNAISYARGKYILPVDSDNMIRPEYITEAMQVLDAHGDIDIVYCDYYLFGIESGVRKAGAFNLQRLMLYNYIDNCSMYRKQLISDIGGYDLFPLIVGNEDWELWLRAAFNGKKFYYLEKPLFDYRVAENSQVTRLRSNKMKGNKNADHLREKYSTFMGPQYVDEYIVTQFRKSFWGYLGKIVLRLYFPQRFAKLVEQGKLRKYL